MSPGDPSRVPDTVCGVFRGRQSHNSLFVTLLGAPGSSSDSFALLTSPRQPKIVCTFVSNRLGKSAAEGGGPPAGRPPVRSRGEG